MKFLIHALAWLPLPLLNVLGGFVGWLMWVTRSSRRRVALVNLARCRPELSLAEQTRLARVSIAHEFRTYLESPRVWIGPGKSVRAAVREWRGLPVLDAAFARGRGVILLSLHQGAFEAVAIPMSASYPFCGLYKPQGGAVDELSLRGRRRFGGRMVPAEMGVRRAAMPLLAENLGIYYMPDHDPPPGSGIFAPFLGQQAHTPTIVARLARQSGAAVVFMYGERLAWGRGYVAHFLPGPDGLDGVDPATATAAMNRGLEACVRACPEQYWWSYRRFRRQPAGWPDFYARAAP